MSASAEETPTDVKPQVAQDSPASPTKSEGKGSRSPKKSSSPRKSQAKPTAKETTVGQPGKYKNSDVEVVVALFERMIAKGDHEDVAAIAEQFGLDKRLLRMSWSNNFRKKGLKLIREGWS